MPTRRSSLDATAVAVMLLLCTVWSMNQVSIKLTNPGMSPLFQAGLRSIGATALVVGWALWRGIPLFRRDGSLWLGLTIAALFACEFMALFGGLVFTTAARSMIFLYTAPFMVAIGAHFLIPGERLRIWQVAGLLCAFAGMLIAFGDALSLPSRRELLGDGLVTLAAIFWAAITLTVKGTRLTQVSPAKLLFYQLGGSALVLPIMSWAVGEPGFTDPSPLVIGAFVYQIVVIAFLTYMTWFWLISRYPAGRLSVFSFLTPILGVGAGWLVLADPVSGGLLAAMVLVGLGIWLVNRTPD